jgi:hypothetical protein
VRVYSRRGAATTTIRCAVAENDVENGLIVQGLAAETQAKLP